MKNCFLEILWPWRIFVENSDYFLLSTVVLLKELCSQHDFAHKTVLAHLESEDCIVEYCKQWAMKIKVAGPWNTGISIRGFGMRNLFYPKNNFCVTINKCALLAKVQFRGWTSLLPQSWITFWSDPLWLSWATQDTDSYLYLQCWHHRCGDQSYYVVLGTEPRALCMLSNHRQLRQAILYRTHSEYTESWFCRMYF